MTSRVFDCQPRLLIPERRPDSSGDAPRRGLGFKAAALTAVLLVPLAGAAEPPLGWLAAGLTALAILILVPLVGGRVRWAWLALLAGAAALLIPRGQLAVIGPALFVAIGLCVVLWLTNRGRSHPRAGDRPRLGTREREAQQVMGFSGERLVGHVLARELSEDFVLINGLKLPRGAGDIDHLVVGPTGVFLLETKTMAGRIVCEPDGTWRRTKIGRAGTAYDAYIGDPAAQVQRNIYSARECLRQRVPRLFRRSAVWIEGLVVFPHVRAELDTQHSRVPAMRLEEATAYICTHLPNRALRGDEVEAIVDALLVEGQQRGQRISPGVQSAQAVVESALMLPVVLVLVFGTLALSRVIQAQGALVTVAHEAARAAALANSAQDAVDQMQRRVDLVAPGLGLNPGAIVLEWDVSSFAAERGQVVSTVRYTVDLRDVPLVAWAPLVTLRAEHVEWVDPFRSGMGPPGPAEDAAP
jgi:hypothetical protein